jgi:hypothetical protein
MKQLSNDRNGVSACNTACVGGISTGTPPSARPLASTRTSDSCTS